MRRSVPEINAGSTADMAFLLLVFFLLVTRISDDIGLRVDLPAIEPPGDATLVLEAGFSR
jgi:biopolymer transport protein ExbD